VAEKNKVADTCHHRNRLTEDRVRDLVCVHSNLGLLEKISKLWTMLKQLLNGNNGLSLV